jgi:hypothetical protein
MTASTMRYRVTLVLPNGERNEWTEYGRSGLINATQSVDWDLKKGDAVLGTVTRLNPSGGDEKEVYRRTT